MGPRASLTGDIRMNSMLTPELAQQYQNPATIRSMLANSKTVAMVGLSPNTQRPSYFVDSYLNFEGYRVIPVNPRATETFTQPRLNVQTLFTESRYLHTAEGVQLEAQFS